MGDESHDDLISDIESDDGRPVVLDLRNENEPSSRQFKKAYLYIYAFNLAFGAFNVIMRVHIYN